MHVAVAAVQCDAIGVSAIDIYLHICHAPDVRSVLEKFLCENFIELVLTECNNNIICNMYMMKASSNVYY